MIDLIRQFGWIPALLLVGGGASLIALFNIWRIQRARRRLEPFARQHGFRMKVSNWLMLLNNDYPSLHGEYHGRPAEWSSYTTSGGGGENDHSTTWTSMQLGFSNPGGYVLTVKPTNPFGVVGRAITGQQEAEVGDPLFDTRFDITSHPPTLAADLFDAEPKLREMLAWIPSMHLEAEGNTLIFRQTGLQTEPERLNALLDMMEFVAKRLEQQHGAMN